jgi:hypothetical protein
LRFVAAQRPPDEALDLLRASADWLKRRGALADRAWHGVSA